MGELGRTGDPPEQWRSQGSWEPPQWLQHLVYANEKAPGSAPAPRVARHVPTYRSEPVIRPQRHRRNLKGRFR